MNIKKGIFLSRIRPVITETNKSQNPELPFGWGDGEPPTPDQEFEENKMKSEKKTKIVGYEETKESSVCHDVTNDQRDPSTTKG